MLGRISSLVSQRASLQKARVAVKPVKATKRRLTSLAFSSPLSTASASLAKNALKINYTKPSAILTQARRGHAGCGMPHDGDEVPGVGMERELRAHLNVTDLKIVDTSGNGSFYYVEVVSPDFEGKSMLACHKIVQGIISNQIQNIHGLQIKTRSKPAKVE